MNLSNIQISYKLFDYFNSDNTHIDSEIINQLLMNITTDYPIHYDKSIINADNCDKFVIALEKIKSILKIKLSSLNQSNIMEEFTLGDILHIIKKEHYHQNMDTSNIYTAYPVKKKESKASCGFHKESLFEHSVLAMCYSILKAIIKKSNTDEIWIAGLTGLLHDVGKVNTLCLYGKEHLGYPYHGSYGSAILSQYGSIKLFESIGGSDVWESICRTIQTHMCSYHTTEINEWTIKRRTISQIETPPVKIISENLSWGDSFGKISEITDIDKFVETRTEYNNFINQEFDVKSFMESNKYVVPVFFIRGSSGSGKTNFVANKLLPYLLKYFSSEMIEIISRDEIMAETTSKRLNTNITKLRPTGSEYKDLYEKFRELKLSKSVNDEIKKRISITISQGRIPIIDSCILYYDGIISCIPENISKGFIIAIDCVRNHPYNISDAEKNGMVESDLESFYKFRNPLKWISDGIKLTILDSIYTHNHPENLPKYLPQLVFSYGWNDETDCGFNMMSTVLKPVVEYFSQVIYEINTDNLDIIQYVNYLYKKFGLDGMKDVFNSQYYRVTDSHQEPRILRMNYLEHNRLWRPKWSRQTRGTTFYLDESDNWIPIKFLLERGTEALTGLHVKDGITATDNIDIGTEKSNSIEDLIASLAHLDKDQINLIVRLVFNQEIPEGLALTFKKDGSLLGCTIYKNKVIENFIKNFIANSGDELAILIMKMCGELNLPLMVFSTQSTIIVGNQMHDYTVHALLASLVLGDKELEEQFTGKSYIQAFEKHGHQVLTSIHKLFSQIDEYLDIESDDTITLSMESICANRKSVFENAVTHTELAISYDSSSITILGVSLSNSSRVKYLPHYKFTSCINDCGLLEPAYWFFSHTENVNKLLTDLHNVIFGKITEEKFYQINHPSNITSNWEKIVDYEGFVSYSMVLTSNSTLNYNKIKTSPYYDLHKLRKEKMNWILELAEIPSVIKRFPMCKEVKAFYSDLGLIEKLVNLILEKALEPKSILFNSLSEKAKISFGKQTKQVQIKMLINSPNGFSKIAYESLSEIYKITGSNTDSDFKEEVKAMMKKLLMASIDIYDLEKLKSEGIVDELFLLVRKGMNITI